MLLSNVFLYYLPQILRLSIQTFCYMKFSSGCTTSLLNHSLLASLWFLFGWDLFLNFFPAVTANFTSNFICIILFYSGFTLCVISNQISIALRNIGTIEFVYEEAFCIELNTRKCIFLGIKNIYIPILYMND